MKRICARPQDVCNVTGFKTRYGQAVIRILKNLLGRKKHQFVTKQELADHLGVPHDSFDLD